MERHRRKGQRRGPPAGQVGGGVDEVANRRTKRGRSRLRFKLFALRAQLVGTQKARQAGGGEVEKRRDEQRGDVPRGAFRQKNADEKTGDGADPHREPAERGDHGIGGQKLAFADDRRQPGRKAGKEETAQAQRAERQRVDDPDPGRSPRGRGHAQREKAAHGVSAQEDLATSPPVEKRAEERADEAVRAEHHHDGRGDPGRGRHGLRAEEEQGGQAGLEHAVSDLGDEPHAQELAKADGFRKRRQISEDAHGSPGAEPAAGTESFTPELRSDHQASRRRSASSSPRGPSSRRSSRR